MATVVIIIIVTVVILLHVLAHIPAMLHLIVWQPCSNQGKDRDTGLVGVQQLHAAVSANCMTIRSCYFRVPSPHREQIPLNHLALGLHNYAKGSAEKSCLFHYCFDFLSYRLIFREKFFW